MTAERFQELLPGGVVIPGNAIQPRTGGWRPGSKPAVDFDRCVNCLLCWVYCPDTAVRVQDATFMGFEYEFCKGCEICGTMCPTDAIRMVGEDTPVDAYGSVLQEGPDDGHD